MLNYFNKPKGIRKLITNLRVTSKSTSIKALTTTNFTLIITKTDMLYNLLKKYPNSDQ